MKSYVTHLMSYVQTRSGQRNIRLLLRYLIAFAALMTLYSLLFHALMVLEGRQYSWLTGFYWTLTVMSTLGFGDITFHSDLGRLFSMIVLLSGMAFLLVLMPFTFIEFFYSPWMRAQSEARAPRLLPPTVQNHAILTHVDPVSLALIQRFNQCNFPYVILVQDLHQALDLHDQGYSVVLGSPDSPGAYDNVQVRQAALVSATGNEIINTNIAFTVREIAPHVPIVTLAETEPAEEILRLAGSSRVLRLHEMMGRSLAHRTIGSDARAHVIGRFEELYIAEATAAGTPLTGKTLAESHLRELAGITVVGVWERGRFQSANPHTRIGPHTVLVLAASNDQLKRYNELFCIYHVSSAPVIVIGGGRVGHSTGEALTQRGLEFVIIERNPTSARPATRYVTGDAASIDVLEQAGIRTAPTVIITPNNDDANIFLTILCRRLRPDIQIITRATLEQNVSTLHRAGADFVMSYASMGANAIFNVLRRADVLMLAEGLSVFRVTVPASLVGKTIAECAVRDQTGCSIVALKTATSLDINPDPQQLLVAGTEMILIGVVDDQNRFLKLYS